jgi:hypothetical protein
MTSATDKQGEDPMTTTTPAEIHQAITAALGDRARLLRRDAASRKLTGPGLSEARARIRAEAQRCEDLARIIGYVSPLALAAVMTKEACQP